MSFSIRADAVGMEVGRETIDVTFRMTSAYAAAIGANDACYLDNGVSGGAVAPPSFLVALEWPILLRQPYIGLIGATEEHYFGVLLHAFQDTHYFRVLRAGERVELVAMVAEIRPTRAGAMVVCKITTRDTAGELVATSWIGSLFRGIPVAGQARAVDEVPALPDSPSIEALPEDDPIRIDRALPFIYTECSGHWNPIHTERAFAIASGYPDLVVHGTSTWAIAANLLISNHASGRPERLKRYGARFTSVLTPDQTIRLHHGHATGKAGVVHFGIMDAAGAPVLSRGVAEFAD